MRDRMKDDIEFLRIMSEGFMEGDELVRARALLGELHRAVDALEEARRAKEAALGDSDALRMVAGLLGVLDVLDRAEEHGRRAGEFLDTEDEAN
jgi:hypothetical protein